MIKKDVRLCGLQPQMVLAYVIAEQVFIEEGYPIILTSGGEGKHSSGSIHYRGNAIDLRTRHVSTHAQREKIAESVKDRLGEEFKVILKFLPHHLHIQYTPMRGW